MLQLVIQKKGLDTHRYNGKKAFHNRIFAHLGLNQCILHSLDDILRQFIIPHEISYDHPVMHGTITVRSIFPVEQNLYRYLARRAYQF